MKVTFTLKIGSYFFLESVSFIKGVPLEVDLSKLPAAEVETLQYHYVGGFFDTDKDILEYEVPEEGEGSEDTGSEDGDTLLSPELPPPPPIPTDDGGDMVIDLEKQLGDETPYILNPREVVRSWHIDKTVRQLKDTLTERGVNFDGRTTKEDLLNLLVENELAIHYPSIELDPYDS